MKRINTLVAAVVGLSLAAVTSQAALLSLTPGGSSGDPSLVAPTIAGAAANSLLGQNLVETFPGTVAIDGKVSTWIFAPGAISANTLGGLTFVYQFQNLNASAIQNFSLTGFGSLSSILVGTVASGSVGGVGTINSTSVKYVNGVVTFQSFGTLGVPTSSLSYLLVIGTSATSFGRTSALAQDGFQAAGAILAPVPEPTTVIAGALLLLPLGASTIRILRKNRKA